MKSNKLHGLDLKNYTYPGFDYDANQISKFMAASDLFTILLKNGEIVHFTANDENSFVEWLIQHDIENIK